MIPCTKIIKGQRTVHSAEKIGPLFVWNIIEQCNLHCAHCYRDSPSIEEEKGLSDEKCLQLVDEIKKMNPPIVLLTGGEPLLRKNIFDIIKRCKEVGLRVGLSTNGTLIDTELSEKIAANGVDYVGISIDGLAEFHDNFRGQDGAYERSWAAVEHLNVIRIKTGVRFTLSKEKKQDLIPILDEAIKRGVKRFCLYHLVYSGRGQDVLDIKQDEKREIMDRFFKRVEELSKIHDDFEVLTTDNHADGIYLLKMLAGEEGALSCIKAHDGCFAGDRVLYLDSTGAVYPCHFLRDFPVGNVNEKSLWDIWHDGKDPLLKMLRNKEMLLKGKCGTCQHKAICGGCRARAQATTGSLWDEDPGCYLQESEIFKNVECT